MRKAKVWDARQLPAYLTVAQYGELMGFSKHVAEDIRSEWL